MKAHGVAALGCVVGMLATACGTDSNYGSTLPGLDAGEDAAVDGGANTASDGGPQTNPIPDPDGGYTYVDGQVLETVSAELTAPVEGGQFYRHEQVALTGRCLGSTQATSRIELEGAGGSIEILTGNDLKHTFAALGMHKVRLVCETPSGARASSERSIELFETPRLVFRSELDTQGARSHLFSTRMDQPGVAQRLDPTGASFAYLRELAYLDADHLIVRGNPLGDRDTVHRLAACRGGSTCAPPTYEELLPIKQNCREYLIDRAPDGQSLIMQYYCDVPDSFGDALTWVDLGSNEPLLHRLGTRLSVEFTPDSQHLIVWPNLYSSDPLSLSYVELDNPTGGSVPMFQQVTAHQFSPDKSRLWVVTSGKLYSLDLTLPLPEALEAAAEFTIPGEPTSIALRNGTHAFGVLRAQYAEGDEQYVARAFAWDLSREVTYANSVGFTQYACGSKLIVDPVGEPPKVLDFSAPGVPPVLELGGGVEQLGNQDVSFDASCTRMLHYASYEESQLVDLQTGEALLMPHSQFVAGGQFLLREDPYSGEGFALFAVDGVDVEETPAVDFLDPLEYVTGVRESPDGQELLFRGDLEQDGDFALYRMAYADLTPRVLATHVAGGSTWEFSPDGSRVAVAAGPGRDFSTGELAVNAVREFDWNTGALLWTSALPSGDRSELRNARRIPGSNRLLMEAFTDASQQLDLYSVAPDGGSLVHHTAGKPGALLTYELSTDGKRIAMGTNAGIFIEPMRSDASPFTPVASKLFDRRFHGEITLFPNGLREEGIVFAHDWNGLSWLDVASGDSWEILASESFPVSYGSTPGLRLGTSHGHITRSRYDDYGTEQYQAIPLEVVEGVPIAAKLDEATTERLPLSYDGRFQLQKTETGALVTDLETGTSGEIPLTVLYGQYRDGLFLDTYPPVVQLFDLRVPQLLGSWEIGDAYNLMYTDDFRVLAVAVRNEAGQLALKVVDTKTTQVRTLVEGGGPDEPGLAYPILSPSGKWILYEDTQGRLKVVASDGTSPPRFVARVMPRYLTFDRFERFLFAVGTRYSWETFHGSYLWNLDDLTYVDQILPEEYETKAGVVGWFE